MDDSIAGRNAGVPAAVLAPVLAAVLAAIVSWSCAGAALAQTPSPAPVVTGDAILAPLTTAAGDAVRGRAIVASRQTGLCLLCHVGPIPEERFQGNLAPNLSGAGSRWSEGQLRLRMVDARSLNPESIMPSYYRTDGLTRVAPALRGQPILTAQQIEDVVAYLHTLRDTEGGPGTSVK
ncbi:MAG: sulfur oxidation c-type cytochrome SoxX [Herminiimonas sp.]|nr:sulfur oxidation c-type cytochrome SoxX [Herminiimonas sp.]